MGKTACSMSFQGAPESPKPRSLATPRKRLSRVELRIVPGETALTVIPSAATAFAKEAVMAFMAALHAE
jgi:hypothetical protein